MTESVKKNKRNASYSIDESLIGQIRRIEKNGDFSSFSDFVNSALIDFSAKYDVWKNGNAEHFFRVNEIKDKYNFEKTKKKKRKISVTVNAYVIKKTRYIKNEMQFDTYSDVVSFALYSFLESYERFVEYENLEKSAIYPDGKNERILFVSEKQLKTIINDEIKKAIDKKTTYKKDDI